MAPALQTPETKETKRNEKKSTALPSSLMRFSICSGCHWSKFYAHLLRLEEKSSLPSVESLYIYIYIYILDPLLFLFDNLWLLLLLVLSLFIRLSCYCFSASSFSSL